MDTFLQTQEWASFQKSLGRKAFFILGESWKALLIKQPLPLSKNYLYCPRGPVLAEKGFGVGVREFLARSMEIAAAERSIFLRWDPSAEEGDEPSHIEPVKRSNFVFYPIKSVQPRHNAIIDLSRPESEMLASMREKTRYNIRLSERKGVRIRYDNGPGALERFWSLMEETARRDKFESHPRSHYEKMLKAFSAEPMDQGKPFCRLYFAEFESRPLSTALVIFYANTATYVHGASTSRNREVMAPQLLHWTIARDAKRLGFLEYDLGGIDENNPRWAGITRFKQGFNPVLRTFSGSIDVALSPFWYGAYRLAKRV